MLRLRDAVGALFALALVACSEEPIVPLVQLGGVAPRQIELGDKLEIEGAGFPQGRKARVMFEGTLSRPSEAPDPDGQVDMDGEVVAPDRIEVPVTDAMLTAFCGAGFTAVHTTFDGSVTVVFAARTPGAPPVSGHIEHVIVDVLPTSAGQARYLADAEEGFQVAKAAGVRVEGRAPAGLVVTAVEPGSRAAKAGLVPDDLIVASNGVRALGVADLAPPPGSASLALVVQHLGGVEEIRTVALDGPHEETPKRFAVPAAIVGGIALLLALLSASPGRFVVWMRRRIARRQSAAPSDLLCLVLGLLTAGALPLLVPSADVSLLALVSFSGAIAVALIIGTEHERSTWRAALVVASRTAPAAIALAGALMLLGSLRADELVAAQGAAPWDFFALRSPAHAALALLCCAWAARRGEGESTPLPRAAERFMATLHAAIIVVVFFGGWRLPLVPVHAHGLVAWGFALAFVVKTALVSLAISRVREALPPASLRSVWRTSWLRFVPLAVAAAFGATLWERHVTSRGAAAATTFALAALGVAALVQLGWPRPAARVRVDPLA